MNVPSPRTVREGPAHLELMNKYLENNPRSNTAGAGGRLGAE